jgi:hypothetical protein
MGWYTRNPVSFDINKGDDFFQLGIDSLDVHMTLTTLASARGILLKPVAVFSHSRLEDFANRAVLSKQSGSGIRAGNGFKVYRPFCLVPVLVPAMRAFIHDYVVPQLRTTAAEAEDMYLLMDSRSIISITARSL